MNNLISIIIANYNRSNLLEKGILSFINQKSNIQFDWEIIIVDDWSTDDSKELIEKYVKKYPNNIKAIFQQNKGVNCARNIWLDNLSKDSTYTIIFDNDDEVTPRYFDFCLKKWEELRKKWEYGKVFTLISFCEDENWKLIGNKNILQGQKELKFWYKEYLSTYFSAREMMSIDKSATYLNNKQFRFDEKQLIWKSILWSNIYKHYETFGACAIIIDYVGRIFRLYHWPRTSKNISKKRFLNSAKSNEKVLELVWKDLLKFSLKNVYNEFIFRIGTNYILWWEKTQWLKYLRKVNGLKAKLIYFTTLISDKIILRLFKIYIRND